MLFEPCFFKLSFSLQDFKSSIVSRPISPGANSSFASVHSLVSPVLARSVVRRDLHSRRSGIQEEVHKPMTTDGVMHVLVDRLAFVGSSHLEMLRSIYSYEYPRR